jgi:hypothetical protein
LKFDRKPANEFPVSMAEPVTFETSTGYRRELNIGEQCGKIREQMEFLLLALLGLALAVGAPVIGQLIFEIRH